MSGNEQAPASTSRPGGNDQQSLQQTLNQARRRLKTMHDDVHSGIREFIKNQIKPRGLDAFFWVYSSPNHTTSLVSGYFEENENLTTLCDAYLYNFRRGGRYASEYEQRIIISFLDDICTRGIVSKHEKHLAMEHLYRGAMIVLDMPHQTSSCRRLGPWSCRPLRLGRGGPPNVLRHPRGTPIPRTRSYKGQVGPAHQGTSMPAWLKGLFNTTGCPLNRGRTLMTSLTNMRLRKSQEKMTSTARLSTTL